MALMPADFRKTISSSFSRKRESSRKQSCEAAKMAVLTRSRGII
jgi:hypothetical protein